MIKGSWVEFDSSLETLDDDKSLGNTSQSKIPVYVQRMKAGKKGKTVTVISGLALNSTEMKKLLKKLKANCGTGGTVKVDSLELQGDQIQKVLELLKKDGLNAKKSGG